MSLLSIFATALLPILTIGAVGFVLGRVRDVDPDALNTVTVYVLAPALVFYSLATTELTGATLTSIVASTAAFHLVMILVAAAVARLVGIAEPMLGALVLVSAFPNSGNYGIPVSSFAFGDVGRSTAVVYLTVQAVLIYTVGVYIAGRSPAGSQHSPDDIAGRSPAGSRKSDDTPPVRESTDGASDGGHGRLDGIKTSLGHVFRIPLVYAVVAALAARWLGVVPPTDIAAMQTLKLVGDSSIPVMLLILGIQLADADLGSTLSRVGLVAALKMAVAPVVAAGIALAVGFGDPGVARTFVLESTMPAAVTPLILVAEFGDSELVGVPVVEFVSAAIFATTLLSVPVLSVVIFLLESGVVV